MQYDEDFGHSRIFSSVSYASKECAMGLEVIPPLPHAEQLSLGHSGTQRQNVEQNFSDQSPEHTGDEHENSCELREAANFIGYNHGKVGGDGSGQQA